MTPIRSTRTTSLDDNKVLAGPWVTVKSDVQPTLAAIPDQIVSTGDAVTVSSTASDVYNPNYEGYVDWGDGTGLYLTDIGFTWSSATLTAKLDAAGDPGQHAGSLSLCGVNEPDNHSGYQDTKSFNVDVWGAKLGDGSNNIIMQASDDGTQNLVPLTLYYPRPAGVATNLKLTISNPGEAVVWNTNDPEDDTPVLGQSDTTVTLNAEAGDFQQTLWVGATEGTTTLNDLNFTLAAAAPGPTTGPTTSSASNPATPISVEIMSNNDPNGDSGNHGDVTGRTRDWLVGQMVDLTASIVAPQALLANISYQWSVPGNVLSDWKVSPESYTVLNAKTNTPTTVTEPQMSALAVPLTRDDGGAGEDETGTAQKRVEFFWVATKDGIHNDTYSVSLSIKSLGIEESTSFDVYEPTLSGTKVNGPTKMVVGPLGTVSADSNITFHAQVQIPSAVNTSAGQWCYVQKVDDRSSWTFTDNTRWGLPFRGVWVLDTQFPYEPDEYPTGLVVESTMDDPSTVAIVKPDSTRAVIVTKFQSSQMYIMFKPYSAPEGDESEWVPLAVSNWAEAGAATIVSGLWKVFASRVQIGQFRTTTAQPQWDVQLDTSKAPFVV